MQNPQPSQTYWIKFCILTRLPPTLGVLYVHWSLRSSVLDCFSHSQGQLNYLCAHVSGWISSPNYSVKCPSLQSLLSQPALPGWICRPLECKVRPAVSRPSSLAFAWSENQVGGSGLFCLTPAQVCIVQVGGFILLYTHPDLSLLGALFLETKIKRLWSISGLLFKYQSLLWVRERPGRVPLLLRWLSSLKISSVDGQHPMTHAGEDVPMTKDPGGQLGKAPWTPKIYKVQGHCQSGIRCVEWPEVW